MQWVAIAVEVERLGAEGGFALESVLVRNVLAAGVEGGLRLLV